MDESDARADHSTGPLWLLPVALALVLVFLGYQQWLGARSSLLVPPVPAGFAGTAQRSLAGAGPRTAPAAFTYYLIGSAEQAAFVVPLLLQIEQGSDVPTEDDSPHALKVVTNADEERVVRGAIDHANQQLTLSNEEPRFRVVDLRPLLTALP